MASWEEIKRLAADFKKVQANTAVQNLSERNCIEIVRWLIDKKMIDLIFTVDGKEYMTQSQLVQDILGELYVSGGRVNLVDIAKSLGVDLAHVSNCINEVTRSNNITHVCGQLIDDTYVARIAGEINEKLIQQGEVNINDLSILYDLPAEYLQQVVDRQLGRIIQASQDKTDPRILFTDSYIDKTKAKMRGALYGITKPTSVAFILNHIGVNEKMFFRLFDQISSCGFLSSRVHGAQYIPTIYSKSQKEWVSSFYRQNGCLEFQSLKQLGIGDPKNYIKNHITNEEPLALDSCIISKKTLEQIDADIDECIRNQTYIDLQNILPSVLSSKDIDILMNKVLSRQKMQQTCFIENYVITKAFIDDILKKSDAWLKEKVTKFISSGKYAAYLVGPQEKQEKDDQKLFKREDQKKKGKGKSKRDRHDSATEEHHSERDSSKNVLKIISLKEFKESFEESLKNEGFPDELIESLAEKLLSKCNEDAEQMAQEIYSTTIAVNTSNKKKMHNEVQDKINSLVKDIKLYEKGIKIMPSDVQPELYKYLFKTLATDVVNEILNCVFVDQKLNTAAEELRVDQKLNAVNQFPADVKNPLSSLLESLSGQNIDKFIEALDSSLRLCGMIIKKTDKKKDRMIVSNHKKSLLEELDRSDDPAVILHLAVLCIFTEATQTMLHASGKHIKAMLPFFEQNMSKEEYTDLSSYHDLVVKRARPDADHEILNRELREKIDAIKSIAHSYKKIRPE